MCKMCTKSTTATEVPFVLLHSRQEGFEHRVQLVPILYSSQNFRALICQCRIDADLECPLRSVTTIQTTWCLRTHLQGYFLLDVRMSEWDHFVLTESTIYTVLLSLGPILRRSMRVHMLISNGPGALSVWILCIRSLPRCNHHRELIRYIGQPNDGVFNILYLQGFGETEDVLRDLVN